MDQRLPVVHFGQGFASMSGACKELERLVLAASSTTQVAGLALPVERGARAGRRGQHQDHQVEVQTEGRRGHCPSDGHRRGTDRGRVQHFTRRGRRS